MHELPAAISETDPVDRRADWLIGAVPRDRRKVYKMRLIIEAVVDAGSFCELGHHFGRSAIKGLARRGGWPVAVLASDPYIYGGGWTANAAQKVTRFIDLAETFHLPVGHLVGNPGFVMGLAAEQSAATRHGSRALAAVYAPLRSAGSGRARSRCVRKGPVRDR